TNMYMTLRHGLESTRPVEDAGKYLRALSEGMLLGARGNSGVILSQFFKGLYLELSRCPLLGPGELRAGLIRGYRTAYDAVINPVEGTMLSAAREGIEHIRTQITRNTSVDSILSMYIAEMKKTLAFTPEMLPVLKEAGVVDSGAYGFILIFEGMLKYLRGEVLTPEKREDAREEKTPGPDLSLFNENSVFTDGYCLEFILQLMSAGDYDRNFRQESFVSELKKRGKSIVCVQDGKRVKVHIHTKKPAGIIHLAQKYGEFLTFKLENMQIQHNAHDAAAPRKIHKPLAIIAAANGEGVIKLFSELGCDAVLDGGETMNASASDFVKAIDETDADGVVILPNNKNVILAAKQAASLRPDRRITVIPSESFAQGYFAIAMDIPDSSDVEKRISLMTEGIESVITLSETTASRDYSYREISCRQGDEIVLRDGELVSVSSDTVSAVCGALRTIPDLDSKETCVVFRGAGTSDEGEADLAEAISGLCPAVDTVFIDGGQRIYHWILGKL
ncbi:MAG: DAK2 domain-containing protein, partial [Clostridia bacterium]|nr:DAK2 domain-containing protein [Clostridia bacterium]